MVSWESFCGDKKDAIFQPSSPIRHATEVTAILKQCYSPVPSILFIYSDGGPDHRLTFVSVQIPLIALYLHHDLDYLCVARTAPCHSWRNPVERVMSLLNLGLQCVGLMRTEMPAQYERAIKNCNSMADIRRVNSGPSFVDAVTDSLSPCIVLLNDLFSRLKLKEEAVQCFFAASDSEIKEFWSAVLHIDKNLEYEVSYSKANVQGKQDLLKFMDHCCRCRHYSFDILKCGSSACTICKLPRLSQDVFSKLHHLPDPIIGDDQHYLNFEEVFGTDTTEKDRPSAQKSKDGGRKFTLKHVKNANIMLMCDDCGLWRLLYSCNKLTDGERKFSV